MIHCHVMCHGDHSWISSIIDTLSNNPVVVLYSFVCCYMMCDYLHQYSFLYHSLSVIHLRLHQCNHHSMWLKETIHKASKWKETTCIILTVRLNGSFITTNNASGKIFRNKFLRGRVVFPLQRATKFIAGEDLEQKQFFWRPLVLISSQFWMPT